MKKLIVLIISVIILSVFLMMNYLLWDKDNLLKQQETDKVQQDWLRGQNKAMEANITELEGQITTLEKDKASLNEQNNSLQRQVRSASDREVLQKRTISEKLQSLESLKTSSLPLLQQRFEGWMIAVNEGRGEDSFRWFSRDFQFLQRVLSQEKYIDYVGLNIQSISYHLPENPENTTVVEITPDKEVLFERIGSEAADLTVLVRMQVYITLKPEADTSSPSLVNGLNTLQVQFTYDTINQKWLIQSIISI